MPTLIRLERGDPGVSLGVLATALWLAGHAQALPELAAPAADRGALEADVRAAVSRRTARSKGAARAAPPRGDATQAARGKPRPARRSRA
jgi:hypothetical protein